MGLTVFQHRWFRRVINRKRLRLSRQYFASHGTRIVFFARFLAGLRAPIFLSAAILRMRLSKFLFIDFLAAAISVPLIVYIAYRFGAQIEVFWRFLRNAKILIIVLVGILIATLWIYRKYRRPRKNHDDESARPIQ